MFVVAFILVAVGLVLLVLMRASQARLLNRPAPPAPGDFKPVSILKPLKGVDGELEKNLRSLFVLNYPQFEILFGAEDPSDPALAIARSVAAQYPKIPSKIIAGGRPVGLNPKVNNLANMLPFAQHEILLISDSNVRVGRNYLSDLVAHLEQPGVGLVSSPIRGKSGTGLGASMERLQLNTFVMGGVAAVQGALDMPCVVGKSMLMRRADLEAIGGFNFLGRYLAEDQICGEEMARRGKKVVAASQCIDQNLGRLSVKHFAQRHLRWAKMRRRVNPAGYVGEFLLNPVFAALLFLALFPSIDALSLALTVLLAKSVIDASAETELGARVSILTYPALVLAKDALIGVLWFVPFVSSSASWRGNALRIGKRTMLMANGPQSMESMPEASMARVA